MINQLNCNGKNKKYIDNRNKIHDNYVFIRKSKINIGIKKVDCFKRYLKDYYYNDNNCFFTIEKALFIVQNIDDILTEKIQKDIIIDYFCNSDYHLKERTINNMIVINKDNMTYKLSKENQLKKNIRRKNTCYKYFKIKHGNRLL